MEASAEVLEGVRKREYVLEVRVLFPKNGAEAEPEEEEEDDVEDGNDLRCDGPHRG